MLTDKCFVLIEVDMVSLARQCISASRYRRGARLYEAPAVVDCSSFIKWLYAERGIWLPRRSIQQREFGKVVSLDELVAGDVVFVSGWIDYYHNDPANGVGHVGIATGDETIIHAAGMKTNVVETPLQKFIGKTKFRGARRYIPKDQEVLTFQTPPDKEVEISDDLRWIILQSLPKQK
ncbi:MAG: hypothetical protein A3B09_02455 [Candidatus Taylorbacteria bacterium RIFCSPLOWO2_01_FULL_43_83]|nr:MAG: hypothetical protein A3B09_02455 [Candidatus Taylorbacteria bacterium RIFCSPLOWO2_01_FULL_43_83]